MEKYLLAGKPVRYGQHATYEIRYRNEGKEDVLNLRIVDHLPSGQSLSLASGDSFVVCQSATENGTDVVFSREASLPPGATGTLRVTVVITPPVRAQASPPYMHDGRCLTLDDTVEFFNLVFQLKLTADEKAALVAFMRAL
jgi:uncharacterized repeat protein (TIGR01451 family)